MQNNNDKNIQTTDLSLLNKKRKKEKLKNLDIIEEKENNKIKKEELKNYLEFPLNPKNYMFNKNSDLEQYLVSRKIYTTTSKYNYDYICQEIKSETTIQINDAKIIYFDNIMFLFLLSNEILYLYEIKEYIKYDLIKKINLNADNNFNFSCSPKNIFFITPKEKAPNKNKTNKNNNGNNNKNKEILFLCILSNKERYLCSINLKKYVFKNIKNFEKKNMPKKLVNNEVKFKLYNKNKILSYNENCAYMQRIFGSPRFKDFKLKDIESISLLNQNLFSISTPDVVYIYDALNENCIGDFKTHSKEKKVKLLKPENNLLMVKSKWDIALYDLESLMIFQKLELNNINNPDEPIKKVKQLSNNNFAILFTTCLVIYNLEKNTVTFKCNYLENVNINNYNMSDEYKGFLTEINPNFILVNNDEKNFYILNSIKGDKIASLNINNDNFSLSKKIKKYNFIKNVSKDKNIEENNNNEINYFIFRNGLNSFILSSVKTNI